MNTPICDFVRDYSQGRPLRMHMPGHKGEPSLGIEHLDITEIPGADVLYQASGIIRESQNNTASLFGSGLTLYSAEGSSLPIRAMLYLAKLHGKGKCTVCAGRNAHKVFITAAALLDMEVKWIYPDREDSMVSCHISPEYLADYLDSLPEMPTAVYITSPDYLGNRADIRGLARVAHSRGCLMMVDNAHGAYLNFLPENVHPIALGADICCDSAHKTLPVLTGGAYLHISRSAPPELAENGAKALSAFASTSPSYLILQSLDQANRYLSDGYREKLAAAVMLWQGVRKRLRGHGYRLSGNEPMKLTILSKSYGYSGREMGQILEKQGIFVEFSDPDHVVMMLSPEWDDSTARRVEHALTEIPRKPPILLSPPPLPHPVQVMPPREAFFAPSAEVELSRSLGSVMALPSVSCPPAIPIVSMGERIDEDAIRAMDYYGIQKVVIVNP